MPADYCRLINTRAFRRVKGLLDSSKDFVVHGGKTDAPDVSESRTHTHTCMHTYMHMHTCMHTCIHIHT